MWNPLKKYWPGSGSDPLGNYLDLAWTPYFIALHFSIEGTHSGRWFLGSTFYDDLFAPSIGVNVFIFRQISWFLDKIRLGYDRFRNLVLFSALWWCDNWDPLCGGSLILRRLGFLTLRSGGCYRGFDGSRAFTPRAACFSLLGALRGSACSYPTADGLFAMPCKGKRE